MPSTEHHHHQSSPSAISSIGRSILSIRRGDQVHAMDSPSADNDSDLESFQRLVAEHLSSLLSSDLDLLSLSWIRKLLDSFLSIQDQFRSILFGGDDSDSDSRSLLISKPPLDRSVSDFFERAVKALDVCNAIRDGIDQVRQWRNHLEIVVTALNPDQKSVGEGQIRRAKKALTDLTIFMIDDKESSSGGGSYSISSHRNRSFGRCKDRNRGSGTPLRSLSWSVSRSWSASRQLQAIGANLSAPRSSEIAATGGLVIPIYTMNSVLLFVMWALVAAIPCQDRGLQAHFSIPRHFPWGGVVMSLHEKILEESKKRDRKNANGLLKEIHLVEKCMRHLNELTDNVQSPMVVEKENELRDQVKDLKEICDALKEGLEPLEGQVREVFRRIVRSRTEGLNCLSRTRAE